MIYESPCVCVSHSVMSNPMDFNPPDSSVHGILQARIHGLLLNIKGYFKLIKHSVNQEDLTILNVYVHNNIDINTEAKYMGTRKRNQFVA